MTSQTPMDHLREVTDLKETIKLLQAKLDKAVEVVQNDIALGLLDEYEDDGAYVFENIRCTPYQTTRWEYSEEFKDYVKQLQERAQYSGEATPKATSALRFKW